MSAPAPRQAGHPRRVVIALALLFIAPVALAFILYYGIGWSPGGRVNHGELVEPPVLLPELALPRALALAYYANASEEPLCRREMLFLPSTKPS